MSTRTLITTIAVLAALLTFPVVASAMPISDPIAVHTQSQPVVPPITSEPVATDDGSGGGDTSTILLIAGLTLVAGAAIGAGGAVARERRGRALQA